MHTEQGQPTRDGTTIEGFDAITGAIQLYIDGVARGDAVKLTEAFRSDARLYGAIGEQSLDMPISEFIDHMAENPADVDGTYRARITSIVQASDAAGAIVVEENFRGMYSFADFFTLRRRDGRWRIVNKTYAHTNGDVPTPR
jgi:hypothetical protein